MVCLHFGPATGFGTFYLKLAFDGRLFALGTKIALLEIERVCRGDEEELGLGCDTMVVRRRILHGSADELLRAKHTLHAQGSRAL